MLDFFERIWKDTPGVVRLATRDKDLKFSNQLFNWPSESSLIISQVTHAVSQSKEVYFSPDLFKPEAKIDKKATKDYVLGSHVVCLDFDGNAPENTDWYLENGIPIPSIRIQSSTPDRQHAYWILDEFITDIPQLEAMRKTVTYQAKADSSGWDAGQLLRPPYTINFGYVHNRKVHNDVIIEEVSDRSYAQCQFPIPQDYRPLVAASIDQASVPPVGKVLAESTFVYGFTECFFKSLADIPDRKRSDTLMAVAYYAAESDCTDSQIYSLVDDAANRWGKYEHRTDRHKRIADIVERAREKYPLGGTKISILDSEGNGVELSPRTVYDIVDMMATEIHIEWSLVDLLSLGGYGIIAGPPGVGKTQASIRVGEAIAGGRDFLRWKAPEGSSGRVLFVSLEMSLAPLKYFFTQMEMNYEALRENFFIMPKGETLPLDTKEGRHELIRQIEEIKPTHVIIDSLSKATHKSLSDDENVRFLNTFFRKLQRDYSCSIIVVAHSKKAQGRVKSTGELDDLYGSRFIGSEADFVITLLPIGDGIHIEVVESKIRLGPTGMPFIIERDAKLNFSMSYMDRDDLVGLAQPTFNTGSWAPKDDETVRPTGEPGDSSGDGEGSFRF